MTMLLPAPPKNHKKKYGLKRDKTFTPEKEKTQQRPVVSLKKKSKEAFVGFQWEKHIQPTEKPGFQDMASPQCFCLGATTD